MKLLKKALGVCLCAVMAISTFTVPVKTDAAAKVKLSAKSATLTVGNTKTLTLKQGKKKVKGVKWKTSNKKVATVSSSGKVKAKKAGKANITATYKKKKYVCKVTVKAKSSQNTNTSKEADNTNNNTNTDTNNQNNDAAVTHSYAISQASASIEVDNTVQLNVTDNGTAVSSGVTWTTSASDVASVSNGLVTAKYPGSATITASIDGSVLTCAVTVTVPDYKISQETATIKTGASNNTVQLNLKNGTANVSGAVWSSSDTSVATVADGLVTAVADGTATIKAAKYGKEYTCKVTVEGFVFSRDVEIEYGLTTIFIDFDLKDNGSGFDPDEIAELEEQGCTVDHDSGNVTKDQQCETVKYTFKRLPATLAEIQSFFDEPEKNDTVDTKQAGAEPNYGGFNAMAANICAACTFKGGSNPADPYFSKDPVWDMFEYINGPASSMDITTSVRQNACNSMKSAIQGCGQNVYKSYFQGAAPTNEYTPDEPYVLEMYKGPYFIDEKYTINGKRPTTYMIFVPGTTSNCKDLNGVASYDTDKYIDVYYSTKEKRWFSYENQFLHVIANDFKPLEEEL